MARVIGAASCPRYEDRHGHRDVEEIENGDDSRASPLLWTTVLARVLVVNRAFVVERSVAVVD